VATSDGECFSFVGLGQVERMHLRRLNGAALVGAGARASDRRWSKLSRRTEQLGIPARADVCLVFSEAGLATGVNDRVWEMVWAKLVINVALNATCALTNATGEAVLRSPPAYDWLGLVTEGNRRGGQRDAQGISLPYAAAAARVRVLPGCRPRETVRAPGHGARRPDRDRGDQRRGRARRYSPGPSDTVQPGAAGYWSKPANKPHVTLCMRPNRLLRFPRDGPRDALRFSVHYMTLTCRSATTRESYVTPA
jgi:hypothetical protein